MSPFPHGPLNKPLRGYLKLLKSPWVWLVRMATYKIRFTTGTTDIDTGKQDVGRFVSSKQLLFSGFNISWGRGKKKHWNQSQFSRPIKNLNDTINRPISIVWNPYWTIYTWRIECITYSCSTKSSCSDQLFLIKPTIFGYFLKTNCFCFFLLEATWPFGSGLAQALLQSCRCVPHVFLAGASLCCLWNVRIHKELFYHMLARMSKNGLSMARCVTSIHEPSWTCLDIYRRVCTSYFRVRHSVCGAGNGGGWEEAHWSKVSFPGYWRPMGCCLRSKG